MILIRINRLQADRLGVILLSDMEIEIKSGVSKIKELKTTADKVNISLPVETSRGSSDSRRPVVEIIVMAEDTENTVIEEVLDVVCDKVLHYGERIGVKTVVGYNVQTHFYAEYPATPG